MPDLEAVQADLRATQQHRDALVAELTLAKRRAAVADKADDAIAALRDAKAELEQANADLVANLKTAQADLANARARAAELQDKADRLDAARAALA